MSNEVPTYVPPAGVHGPTLGRDLPDGCERLSAMVSPERDVTWIPSPALGPFRDDLYWWRWPALKVGDRVQFTGTVTEVYRGCYVQVDGDQGGTGTRWFPPAALTRVVDQ